MSRFKFDMTYCRLCTALSFNKRLSNTYVFLISEFTHFKKAVNSFRNEISFILSEMVKNENCIIA